MLYWVRTSRCYQGPHCNSGLGQVFGLFSGLSEQELFLSLRYLGKQHYQVPIKMGGLLFLTPATFCLTPSFFFFPSIFLGPTLMNHHKLESHFGASVQNVFTTCNPWGRRFGAFILPKYTVVRNLGTYRSMMMDKQPTGSQLKISGEYRTWTQVNCKIVTPLRLLN